MMPINMEFGESIVHNLIQRIEYKPPSLSLILSSFIYFVLVLYFSQHVISTSSLKLFLVEDEDSQDYIFNHINTPQYQISIFHIILLICSIFCWFNPSILAGHPVLRGYWSQRRFLKDLVSWFNNATYED
ncbi:hypothetical protein GQ457_15G005130 [Hibiscus cannabinus]